MHSHCSIKRNIIITIGCTSVRYFYSLTQDSQLVYIILVEIYIRIQFDALVSLFNSFDDGIKMFTFIGYAFSERCYSYKALEQCFLCERTEMNRKKRFDKRKLHLIQSKERVFLREKKTLNKKKYLLPLTIENDPEKKNAMNGTFGHFDK